MPAEPSTEVLHGRSVGNRLLIWVLATRPAFLTASVLPVLIGIAWAWREQGGQISLTLSLLAIAGIVFIHAGANVLNDYFDAKNGTDDANQGRIFPFTGGSRFIQNGILTPSQTGRLGAVLLGIGALIGLWLVNEAGWPLLLIGLIGAAIAVAYSAPPCLACRGLGDLAIALDFGLLPVAGTVLLLTGQIPAAAWWLGAIIGCYAAAILWINSIPDIEADRSAGKMTLPARLGAKRAAPLLAAFFLAGAAMLLFAPLPSGARLALLGLVPGAMAVKNAAAGNIADAIPLTLMTHALVGVALVIGLAWW